MQQKANTAKDAQTTEQILNLPVEQIRPFDNHPFQVNDDDYQITEGGCRDREPLRGFHSGFCNI